MLSITKPFEGHDIALRAVVGSHNYNLDTKNSDVDYKYFVWPTLDDLLDAKRFHREVVTETEDFTVHDVRQLPDLFWKANLNFLEIMYSIRITGDPELLFYMEMHREELACSNMPRIYESCLGTSLTKQKLMLKDSPARHESIEKYGYDTKSAHHALRVLNFLNRLAKYGDVKMAFEYERDNMYGGALLDIKNGKHSLEEVKALIASEEELAKQKHDWFYANPANREPYEKFYEAIKNMIKERIKR